MTASRRTAERNRLNRIHSAFVEVRACVGGGDSLHAGLKKIRYRCLRGPYKPYSVRSLQRLYVKWSRDPRPETVAPRYRPGRKPVPPALVVEMLRRLRANLNRSFRSIFAEMQTDWRRGIRLPGIGSWKRKRRTAPPFPFSESTLRSHANRFLPVSIGELRKRWLAAKDELRQLDGIFEALLTHPGSVSSREK